MTSKRITIVMDDDLIQKLRQIQAQKIRESSTSVSFSQVLNDLLKIGLKKR